MTTELMIVLIYFVAFAVINFAVYMKLSKYWYMTAGVTKKDVAVFMSEHITDRRFRYLIRWLRNRAKNSKQFNIMLFFLAAAGFLALPVPSAAFIAAWNSSMAVLRFFMAAEAIGTIFIAVLGFSYGRKIEAESESYYASAQYKPYEREDIPEEIDDLDELYEEPEEEPLPGGADLDETEERLEFKKFITGYVRKLIIAAVLLFCLFSPIILNGFNFKTFKFETSETTTSASGDYTEDGGAASDESRPEVNITYIRELLIEKGYTPQGSLEQVSEKYPDFLFEDCLSADDMEIHFEYFKLVNTEQAKSFSERLRQDISAEYAMGARDIENQESNGEFSIYTLETDAYYAAEVLEGEGVLYVRCDNVSTTWMKVFLYDLGYLEEF